MKITEYTVEEHKGKLEGLQPYHYWTIKLGENMYFRDDDWRKGISVADNEGSASHIAKEEYAVDLANYLRAYFDEKGHFRLNNPENIIPPLYGLAEAAEMLGWDKRKLSTYVSRGTFPEPAKRSASGPLWTYRQIQDYKEGSN